MVGERIQSKRPFTSPILEMVIREFPEPPEAEPVLPVDVVRSRDVNEAIEDSVRQAFADVESVDIDRDITVSGSASFNPGFGTTQEYKIHVNVNGASPQEVNDAVEQLVDEGYIFEFIHFS